jgi:hypothetical protein
MISETRNNPNATEVVIGYFASSDDAQRTIDDLLETGFSSRQIGAAFRSRDAVSSVATTTGTSEVGSKTVRDAIDSNTIGSGPASDSRAVTPAGLSTGSGSVISGAGKPGPIPGSEIPHHRRSETMASDAAPSNNPLPATGSFHEAPKDDSWWQKLKHVFGGESDQKAPSRSTTNDTSMNFGTGEGHLATYPGTYDYAYSESAFESAFSGMGVKQNHARSLIGELGNGGAIVSVSATGDVATAERIMEKNHGRIRYEATNATIAREDRTPAGRVMVFGEVSRIYPGYLPASDTPSRKAS